MLMTPDSWNSSQRSLPSRVRSPTPANTDTPPCALATLLISSMMVTVLPTPARPNRPILPIEVVALAATLPDAGEHRQAAVRLGDVVDQLHDGHGLADAGATEQADLAALGVGREQIHDLDAGDEDLSLGRLVGI